MQILLKEKKASFFHPNLNSSVFFCLPGFHFLPMHFIVDIWTERACEACASSLSPFKSWINSPRWQHLWTLFFLRHKCNKGLKWIWNVTKSAYATGATWVLFFSLSSCLKMLLVQNKKWHPRKTQSLDQPILGCKQCADLFDVFYFSKRNWG